MPYVVSLTPSDIQFGDHLLNALKEKRFPYRGLFWLYDEASDDWQLIVVTELLDAKGPRGTYLELSKITKAMGVRSHTPDPVSDLQLLRVSAMSPQNPIYVALHSVFGTTASVNGARLQNTVVNGIYLTAYLYEVR